MSNIRNKTWRWYLGNLALILAVTSTLAPPLGYFTLKYEYEKASIEFEAEGMAKSLSRLVYREPQLWRFHLYELDALASAKREKYSLQNVVIYDADKNVLSGNRAPLGVPKLTESHPIFDSGVNVGNVEISRSIQHIVIDTALVALFSFMFGLIVYFIMRTLPMRALKNASFLLHEEKKRAEITLDSISEAVIRINARGAIDCLNPVAENILAITSERARNLQANSLFRLVNEYSGDIIADPVEKCLSKNQNVALTEDAILV